MTETLLNVEAFLKPGIVEQLPAGCEVVRNDRGAVLVSFGAGERVSLDKLVNFEKEAKQ